MIETKFFKMYLIRMRKLLTKVNEVSGEIYRNKQNFSLSCYLNLRKEYAYI